MDNRELSVEQRLMCEGCRYMYNEQIAELTQQGAIKQEIMYRLHEKTNFIYEIIGENGCGKTTLINELKRVWLNMSHGVVLTLKAPVHNPVNNYEIFENLVVETEQRTECLKDILVETLKEIPYVGNLLSSITTELINYDERKKQQLNDDLKEELIVKKLNSYIKGKEVLFLCFNFEIWDFKSRNLLINMILHKSIEKYAEHIYYLVENTQSYFSSSMQFYKSFYLTGIERENINDVMRIFNPSINLTQEQQERLYNLTRGNLELLKECSILSLVREENEEIENIIRRSISKKTEAVSDVLSLLKQVAFIGQDVNSILLNHFSDLQEEQYDDALDVSIQLEYLKENEDCISFVKNFLYNYYRKSFCSNRKYYIRLSKCLRLLYPSRYDMQFQYLYRGGMKESARTNLFLFLIQYYRENNCEYNISQTTYRELLEGGDFLVFQHLCQAYRLYKYKQYAQAEAVLDEVYTNKIEFRFEIHYLHALITTNMCNSSYRFREQIDILQQYNTDDFKESYPEMYIRNYMILVEFYAELEQEEHVRRCLKEINHFFSQHISTDFQMNCYEQCFKMKANAFYKIEIAYNYTKKAYQFFERKIYENTYLSKFYIALLNHSANEIVIGNYKEAYDLLLKAHNLTSSYKYLQCIHEDVLINNMAISGFFLGCHSEEECIRALEIIVDKKLNTADIALIRSNLAVFYTLIEKYDVAVSILSGLYEEIEYNDDIDMYYQYYILNNYGILLWLRNDERAKSILEKSFSICPWSQDVAYFNARTSGIRQVINFLTPEKLLSENSWQNHLYTVKPKTVGSAWKFWSSLMIFSELQIWSDY